MIAQIQTITPTNERGADRIPPYIYPDSEDRDRVVVFNITGYTQTEVFQIDLSIQQRGGGRWLLGRIERQNDGWAITYIQRTEFNDGVIHESPEAAAIAAHEAYQDAKRAARALALR
jgi:hypothetical protein